MYTVKEEDFEMNAAIERAVKSYPSFENEWKKQDSANSDFSVKVKFAYDGGHEHMWVNGLYYKGDALYGVLDSDPVNVHTVKAGDSIEIKKDAVSDWMYVRNGVLVGGYTIRVLYNKMSEDEKKQFEQELPFKLK